MNENDDIGWILGALAGLAGLVGIYLFSSPRNPNEPRGYTLPPPPVNKKPCGCGH